MLNLMSRQDGAFTQRVRAESECLFLQDRNVCYMEYDNKASTVTQCDVLPQREEDNKMAASYCT